MLLVGLFAGGSILSAFGEDPRPRLKASVSVFNLGEAGGKTTPKAAMESLADWADATPAVSSRWDQVPRGAPEGGWISIVVCGFNQEGEFEQQAADVFAFLFDPQDGAVNAVAHLHYGMRFNWNAQAWYWAVPIERLCSDLGYARKRNRGQGKPELLRLQVAELHESGAETPALMKSDTGTESPRLDATKALPQITAMAAAAAAKAGWRPRLVDERPALSLGVKLKRQAASFRLTDHTRTDCRWADSVVPTADFAAQLIRSFYVIRANDSVFAVARVGAQAVLSGQGGSLCVTRKTGADLLNGLTGAEVWRRGIDARPAQAYTSRPAGDAPPLVYQYAPELALLDLRTGEPRALAPIGADQTWGFDVGAETTVVAHKSSLSLFLAGEKAWTQDEETRVTCGPRIAGRLVLAGSRGGRVVARSVADGTERWRQQVAPGLRGPVAVTQGMAAVWSDETETTYALDIESGRLSWQLRVGDALAAPVQTVGDCFLAAGKDNRIRLLAAKDGKVAAEATWTDWLVDCRSVDIGGRSVIVCLDITRTLTILDPGTLAVTRRLRMPEALRPGILYLPQAPASWRAADDAQMALVEGLGEAPNNAVLDTRPGIVVVDQQGFAYMIAIGGRSP